MVPRVVGIVFITRLTISRRNLDRYSEEMYTKLGLLESLRCCLNASIFTTWSRLESISMIDAHETSRSVPLKKRTINKALVACFATLHARLCEDHHLLRYSKPFSIFYLLICAHGSSTDTYITAHFSIFFHISWVNFQFSSGLIGS